MNPLFRPIIHRISLAIAGAIISIAPAFANACTINYLNGVEPQTLDSLSRATTEICYSKFALNYSAISRTSLWAAQKLTQTQVYAAMELIRVDDFHVEPSIVNGPQLSDYTRSGYDRGHLAPNGDMPDQHSQNDSFSLANVIPQNPENNRKIWSKIEATVRRMAVQYETIYVVTGVIYASDTLKSVKGRVLVPTHIFKAVYIPSKDQAAAYLVENNQSQDYNVMSIDSLSALSGIDPFPTLDKNTRATAFSMPIPQFTKIYPTK
jgi:endonuclease G, mitochondrial